MEAAPHIDIEHIALALITLATTLGANWLAGWWQKRKTQAEAEKQEAEANEIVRKTVMELIEPLNLRIKELKGEVSVLRGEVEKLGKRNKSLWLYVEKLLGVIKLYRQQLIDHAITPCVEPPDWVEDEGK
jgi:hypothetical protein